MLRPISELQREAGTALEGPIMAGVSDDNMPFVTCDGITFFRFPLDAERHNAKIGVDLGVVDYGFGDCLDSAIVQILKDIAFRHQADRHVVPHMHCDIGPGDIVVEAGAYLGYYSMFFCRRVGPAGRVLGIEMHPECHAVMARNFAYNFPGVGTAINRGVWNGTGSLKAFAHKNHANSFRQDVLLTACHAPASDFKEMTVPADTLENILAEQDVTSVKLLTMQVNGAEVEACQGIGGAFDMVENIFVAAPYGHDGGTNVEAVVEVIEPRGFDIRIEGRTGVFAKRRR